jgi:hypothetical protein
MPRETIAEEYVRLALAIDKHLPGYIDAYFGPPDWQAQAKSEGVIPLPELARRASLLAGAVANDNTMHDQRKDFLTRHVLSMQTSLRLLQGERMPLAEEVKLLYDVQPAWVEETLFEDAHRKLEDLLPPGETMRERMAIRKKALEISVEQVKQLLPLINQRFRSLTHKRFPLPDDESIDFTFVQNQPWGAYNWYLGHCHSRVEINTDLPIRINSLANLIAHEGYPGHHTELSIKDSQLVQQVSRFEHSVALINSPSCVISEGLASCALSTIMPDEALVAWYAGEILPMANLSHLDAQREYMIDQALENLAAVSGNAAFLLHDQAAELDKVSNYLQRYGFSTEKEARKAIEFFSHPLYRSYTYTYYWGKKMLKSLFALKQDVTHWYTRLLTEAVTPSQVRQWMLE